MQPVAGCTVAGSERKESGNLKVLCMATEPGLPLFGSMDQTPGFLRGPRNQESGRISGKRGSLSGMGLFICRAIGWKDGRGETTGDQEGT